MNQAPQTAAPQTAADKFDPVVVDPAWVASLPEYLGPTKVRALQIQHVETYGPDGAPRNKKGGKVKMHQSLASLPTSAVPATERQKPEDYGEHAAARITPVDKSYAAFEVDEAYMRDNRPHTGGFYIVYETGAEGFDAPEVFKQRYTLVVNPKEQAAKEKQAAKIAQQAIENAEAELKAAQERSDKGAAVVAAQEKLDSLKGAVTPATKAADKK